VFYPEEDVRADKPRRELEVATEKGRIEDEGWRVRKDGSRFLANVVITALRDGSGTLVGFAKVTRDLTARRAAEEQGQRLSVEKAHKNAAQDLAQELEQSNLQLEETLAEVEEGQEALKAAEERMRFLVQAGDTLAASLDYETNLQALARMVVPDLADWCVVEMAADGQTHQLAVAHVNPTKVQLARDLSRRYPQNAASLTGAPHVIRTGQPQLYAKITEQMLQAGATNREHLALQRELNLKSAMILPLIARGR